MIFLGCVDLRWIFNREKKKKQYMRFILKLVREYFLSNICFTRYMIIIWGQIYCFKKIRWPKADQNKLIDNWHTLCLPFPSYFTLHAYLWIWLKSFVKWLCSSNLGLKKQIHLWRFWDFPPSPCSVYVHPHNVVLS